MRTQGKYLVVACGDPGQGDRAAGLAIATTLADLAGEDVEILCLDELGPELAADLAAADHVIFVGSHNQVAWPDLMVEEVEAGARYSGDDGCDTPEQVLMLAQVLYGRRPDAWLVAMRAFDTRCGQCLSQRGLKMVDAASRIVRSMLPTGEPESHSAYWQGPWPASTWN